MRYTERVTRAQLKVPISESFLSIKKTLQYVKYYSLLTIGLTIDVVCYILLKYFVYREICSAFDVGHRMPMIKTLDKQT